MADFSHLRELEVTSESTTEFTLHQITVNGKSPTLIMAPATEANKPYFNALLKRSGKTRKQVQSGNINAGIIEENREEDRALYPKYVVKGWRDTLDADGSELEFNRDNCEQLLDALPNWMFDDVRNHAGNPANYSDLMDLEVNVGNSPGGSSGN